MLLAGIGMLVIAIVFFALKIPVVGGVFLALMLVCGVVALVQMGKASKEMREWARSVNSDGDKQPR
jgi:hypothetical protein